MRIIKYRLISNIKIINEWGAQYLKHLDSHHQIRIDNIDTNVSNINMNISKASIDTISSSKFSKLEQIKY